MSRVICQVLFFGFYALMALALPLLWNRTISPWLFAFFTEGLLKFPSQLMHLDSTQTQSCYIFLFPMDSSPFSTSSIVSAEASTALGARSKHTHGQKPGTMAQNCSRVDAVISSFPKCWQGWQTCEIGHKKG